jgi:hypothetical protein
VPSANKLKAQEDWEMKYQEVVSWLVALMEPHISKICTYQESTKEVCDYLQEIYDQNKKISHIYNLK